MKNITFLMILLNFTSFSQVQYHQDSSFYFEKVYQIDFEKNELSEKVNEWIALNFINSKEVLKLNTEDKIIIKSKFRNTDADFILIIEFKNERYKLLIDNITKFDKPKYYNDYIKNDAIVSFNEFISVNEKALRSEGMNEKIIKRTLNNEKLMRVSYNSTESYYTEWINKNNDIKRNLENIAISLYSYLQNEMKTAKEW